MAKLDPIRKLARETLARFRRESGAPDAPVCLSVAPVYNDAISKYATTLAPSTVRAVVCRIYWRETGFANPLSGVTLSKKTGAPNKAGLARAIRKARDENGPLSRWEILAARASAGIDLAAGNAVGTSKPLSRDALDSYYALAGGVAELSYVGRGTKAGAPKTRESATVEIDRESA